MPRTPETRFRRVNAEPERAEGRYVLYWMTAARRTRRNFGLQRAAERASELGRPLVVLEALRCGYRWASDRLHRFVIDGMRANRETLCGRRGVLYHPWVERSRGEGSGLLETLAGSASLVVTDDFPAFFLPRMVEAAGRKLDVRLEAVDSNGLLPLRATDRVFARAHDFRRHLHRELPHHLRVLPDADPVARLPAIEPPDLPAIVRERWPAETDEALAPGGDLLEGLPIDHAVNPVDLEGGSASGAEVLRRFVEERLPRYAEERNEPAAEATSGLSPYLHFGHVGAHEVLASLAERENWSADDVGDEATGKRSGWWGMSESAEAFLDELVTWRELGFNMAARRDDYDRWDSLPDWARRTLEEHADDDREYVYGREVFEEARTHDELWNAAQRQLRREGRIHNYLRMLWGKKILGWSESPREALRIMIELNNRWALDGRDPNSYSGIFWCLGRYDRAWGPERPVFGKVRYMTSGNTARKYDVKPYLEQYGP